MSQQEIKPEGEPDTATPILPETVHAPEPSPLVVAPKKIVPVPQAKLPWLNSQKPSAMRQQNLNNRNNNTLKQRRQTPRSGNR